MRPLAPAVAALGMPLALLAVAWLIVHRPASLPPGLVELVPTAVYPVLAVAALAGLAFHRGRVVFAAAALAAAYAGWVHAAGGERPDFASRTVFAGIAILAPAVIAALAWLEERGTVTGHAFVRLATIAAAVALVWWVVASGRAVTTRWAYAPISSLATPFATPLPQLGLVAAALGLGATFLAAFLQRSATVAGLGWALAALVMGLHFSAAPIALPAFVCAGGLALVLALLQETYRLAFRDELTGLPSRRALEERLKAVGRNYALAMVDVDHFKKFNDTYGHDVGDQVLRMVASRLARIRGGGRAFRYGGEEFTVLFAGKGLDEAAPHLEALRGEIEAYRMAIRRPDRPRRNRAGKRHRSEATDVRKVSVTVSIGLAERTARHDTPAAVIKAADKALYRAKRAGRNQLAA